MKPFDGDGDGDGSGKDVEGVPAVMRFSITNYKTAPQLTWSPGQASWLRLSPAADNVTAGNNLLSENVK